MSLLEGHLRIVVSGAAGFIGSHMCDRLLAEGHTVVALDNFLTGAAAQSRASRRPARASGSSGRTSRSRSRWRARWMPWCNMASPASPKDYLEHPIETLDVGSPARATCSNWRCAKGARFLLTSTSECYGDPLVHPQVETYWGNVNPVGPRSCYDESKRFAEALTMAYHRTHGLRTNIARIFNTYGPRMKLDDGRVVPAFLDQALRGEPMTIFGDGSQTRSFCYVSDLVDGLYRLMQSDERYPVNLGNPARDDHSGVRRTDPPPHRQPASEIVFQPLPEDDPKQRQPGHRQGARAAGLGAACPSGGGIGEDRGVFPRSVDGSDLHADAA